MDFDKEHIVIGTERDGFYLRHEESETYIRIDQEDDPSKGLKELFETLGYRVTLEECY